MKSGASDPFADEEPDPEQPTATESEVENTSSTTETTDPAETSDELESSSNQAENQTTSESNTGQFNRSDLPYILRREKVKDERDDVHQLFVQVETDEAEESARRTLADRFEESVYKLDIREAIYLAGMENLADAEDILREWGYDL